MPDTELTAEVERRVAAALREDDLPTVDLAERELQPADLTAYRRLGVLVVRNLLSADELASLGAASERLIRRAWEKPGEPDFVASPFGSHAEPIPYKVDYILDKDPAFRVLAAHPHLLALAEAISGPAFVPTWDTLVFKDSLAGPRIPWHRDCAAYENSIAIGGDGCLVDVGVYLDAAEEETALRCLPGSCYWPDEIAAAAIETLNREWDDRRGIPVCVRPGDAILHNVLTLHSAPETSGVERRVVYYEYRPAEVELNLGPHLPGYVAEKQRVLRDCLSQRRPHRDTAERPFEYRPPAELARWPEAREEGFRIAHSNYWAWQDVEPEPR